MVTQRQFCYEGVRHFLSRNKIRNNLYGTFSLVPKGHQKPSPKVVRLSVGTENENLTVEPSTFVGQVVDVSDSYLLPSDTWFVKSRRSLLVLKPYKSIYKFQFT